MTMTTKKALAERERLHREEQKARESIAPLRKRIEELEGELKRFPRARSSALREQARGGAAVDLDKLDREQARAEREFEQAKESSTAAHRAMREAQREQVLLHFKHFGAFADHAESLTEAAREALDGLRAGTGGYVEAYEAIEAAREEWRRIVTDHNRVLTERLGQVGRASGELSRRKLSQPPANPLSSPAQVFGTPAIRPAEVEPLDEAA